MNKLFLSFSLILTTFNIQLFATGFDSENQTSGGVITESDPAFDLAKSTLTGLTSTQTFSGANTFYNPPLKTFQIIGGNNESGASRRSVIVFFSTNQNNAFSVNFNPSEGHSILRAYGAGPRKMIFNTDVSYSEEGDFAVDENGNIGVNTSTPLAKFHGQWDAGSLGPLVRYSTGSTDIFAVGGSSTVSGVPFFSSGTVTAPNFHINRDSLIHSTFQANRYDGYTIIPGSITALGIGESYTFVPDGFTFVEIPVLTELAGGAESNQVRLTAKTATSFTIKNHSALAAKDVYFWCLGKR